MTWTTDTWDTWENCYPSNWNGMIVPEAMSHPAKYSSKLIRRIYNHMDAEGWVEEGDTVVDPFGGVALGALDAMRLGLHWRGVELEAKFAGLGTQNIEFWIRKFGGMPRWGTAKLYNGDSRRLLDVIGAAGAAVSSPPYAESLNSDKNGIWWSKVKKDYAGRIIHNERIEYNDKRHSGYNYGATPGQLGAMKAAGFEAAVSSPPYDAARVGTESGQEHCGQGDQYGVTDGQLGGADGFWPAAREIVAQVYMALRPDGHAAWVVKDYVKAKQIVPFCDQWRQLCESVGFETIHEHRAMLVHATQHGFNGEVKRRESKSFFRRLAEKNGSPRIDYEVVYCMVKPEST